MPFETKNNSGALFGNDKGGNPNRPDFKGNLNIGGVEYDISAWKKASKAGKSYLSLSVQPKRERQTEAPRGVPLQGKPQVVDDFDDDLPF